MSLPPEQAPFGPPTRSRPHMPGRSTAPPEGWDAYLDRDETLLWEGAPVPGLRVRASDLAQSIFGLFFLGFAIFWMWGASGFGTGDVSGPFLLFPLFGLPFVLVGAYLSFGHFFWSAFLRSRTRYALTDRRAIVAKRSFTRSLKSYPIDAGTEIEYEPGQPATVWLAREARRGNKGRTYTVKRGFEYISDGARVYRTIRDIQQSARERQG